MATQTVWQATGGFWDKIYSGAAGTVRWGMQYSYTQRILFPGTGLGGQAPKTYDNMVLTALRWYPFELAAAASGCGRQILSRDIRTKKLESGPQGPLFFWINAQKAIAALPALNLAVAELSAGEGADRVRHSLQRA